MTDRSWLAPDAPEPPSGSSVSDVFGAIWIRYRDTADGGANWKWWVEGARRPDFATWTQLMRRAAPLTLVATGYDSKPR